MTCSESRTFRRLLGLIPVGIIGGFVVIFALDDLDTGIALFAVAGFGLVVALLVWFVFPIISNWKEEKWYNRVQRKRMEKEFKIQETIKIRESQLDMTDDDEVKKFILYARKDAEESLKKKS
ncbi:MAG: DUF2207 domain-containing protein [Candidatus Heimdallarchaeota archaeon]|nr:DUF2207 domain-containing protein [Candidatus Heimdallarchaeota archaeon]